MTTFSPRLGLPFIEGAQAQKHVTHTAKVERLDVITQLTVQAFGAETPPASPVERQCWAPGPQPTGVWASHQGQIATFASGGWLFVTPAPGWRAWGLASGNLQVFQIGAWGAVTSPAQAPDLNNLPGVGINASSDTTNRLVVSAAATLLTPAGSGHQLKINKATTGATGSLLYQTGFSGRAEMGQAGNNDFSIKVSANGSVWTEALRIDVASGAVSLPATRTRQLMAYIYRHYLFSDRRWTATSANDSSTNAGLGTSAAPEMDWNSKGIFVPAGTSLRAFTVVGAINGADIVDMEVGVYYQYGPWNGGWTGPTTTVRTNLHGPAATGISSANGMNRIRIPLNFITPADGYVFLATRPLVASNISGTQYFECAGALDLSCPLNPV